MKTKYINKIVILFTALVLFHFAGCTTVETIYLGDVDVNAPICPPPTHININKEVGDVTISPRFAINTNKSTIDGATEDRYTSEYDFENDSVYKAKPKNLTWNISNFTVGVDLDYKVWETFSIFGGVNYSAGGTTGLVGGNIGISFHDHIANPMIRLDMGLTIQEYEFTAITIVHTETSSFFGHNEDWNIYADKGSVTNFNPFGTLTVNSTNDSSQFNWFVSAGFFTQNLLGFEPGTKTRPIYALPFPFPIETKTKVDTRSDMLAGFLFINPGISISLSEEIKILLSLKINHEMLATDSDKWFIYSAAQIDFQF